MHTGPVFRDQMRRLKGTWKQGEHILVSGSTGSGKTMLARHLDEIRLQNKGYVIVFVSKMKRDAVIEEDYRGWTRWSKMKKRPAPHENRVLLWPDVHKEKGMRAKRIKQKEVFQEAFDIVNDTGNWTLHVDEGLYTCDPKFMNLSDELAMLHAQGRSNGVTIITLVQRPSNVPLILYGSASHAFVGRTREASDLKRLAEMGGRATSKEIGSRIAGQGRHDFLWVPVTPDWEPETVNLAK